MRKGSNTSNQALDPLDIDLDRESEPAYDQYNDIFSLIRDVYDAFHQLLFAVVATTGAAIAWSRRKSPKKKK